MSRVFTRIRNKFVGGIRNGLDAIWAIAVTFAVVSFFALIATGLYFLFTIIKLTWVLGIVVIAQFAVIAVMAFFIRRLAILVMICEDDYSELINSLREIYGTIQGFQELEMYFDNQEIANSVKNLTEDIKLRQMDVESLIERFVKRSNGKFETIVEAPIPPEHQTFPDKINVDAR
ncbi:MAG: hypothetical protein WDA29_08265 [Flavobacteriaceae bacterium]